MYAILALYVTFYVMCYARLLVCNAKTLIHLQNIMPLHANTTKHTL